MNKKESGNSSVEKQIKPSIHDKLLQNRERKISANRQAALQNEKRKYSK